MTTESTTEGGTGAAAAETGADAVPGSTLLTDGEGTQAGADATTAGAADGDDGTQTKAAGKAEGGDSAAEGAPEQYEDFKLPDGAVLAAEAIEETKTLAKELGLSQEKAQKLADLLAKTSTAADAEFAKRQADAVKGVVGGWVDEVRKDKEIGGEKLQENLAKARAAMDATATPELRALLKGSGLGNNVHVIRHFLRLAPMVSQDRTMQAGAQPGGPKDRSEAGRAARLYPTTSAN